MAQFGDFFKEVLRDYAKRFWIFWIILYVATIGVELSRQVFLETIEATRYLIFSPQTYSNALFAEFMGHPLRFWPVILMALFNIWGFVSLYFAYSGLPLKNAVVQGLKKIHRVFGYVLTASSITLLGFFILFIPLSLLVNRIYPSFYTSDTGLALGLPIFLVSILPAIYILISFSSGPFIFLFENKNIFQSLVMSWQRIKSQWFLVALYLTASLLTISIAYYLLAWLIFTLKLAFIPNLSLRGESMLRVFLYSLPWVILASFYDLIVYKLYLLLRDKTNKTDKVIEGINRQKSPPGFSTDSLKVVSIFILIAFSASFVLVPLPVQAGGSGGFIFSWLIGLLSCLGLECSGFLVSFAVSSVISLAVETLTTAITGTQSLIGGGLLGGCKGSYDPIFGSCTTKGEATQEIRVSRNVKFTKVEFPDIPSPSEFAANPNSSATVTFNWQADAQPGLINRMAVIKKTGETFNPNCTSTPDTICSAIPVVGKCLLPYETELQAQIWFASCFQVAAKEVRPTCSGCGGDVLGVKYDFTTPTLPLPRADIKADGKDGNIVFKPGVPVTLTWATEYALTAEASGSWSGTLSTSGSQKVVPQTGNEVYTIIARRGDKSGSDSVSSAPATPQIQIYDSKSGGSGGGLGTLRIDSFNITNPLNPGDTVTISWSVSGAKSCEVDNGIGQIPTVGSVDITFIRTTTFTITCSDKDGNTVSAKRTVEVKKIPGLKEIKPE